jgi:hypothetical protein
VNAVMDLGFHKMQRISWLAENRLVSQEKLYSMEEISKQVHKTQLSRALYTSWRKQIQLPVRRVWKTTDDEQWPNNSRIYSSSYLNYWIYISMSSKNSIRRINFEQRTSCYYKSELQPKSQKIQLRNPHLNAPRVQHKKQNYMDSHTNRGNPANCNCHRSPKNWLLVTKPQIRPSSTNVTLLKQTKH